MDAGLEGYLVQLQSIEQDLPGIVAGLDAARFNWRPSADRWSVGQCVGHLNITAERYLPVLRADIANARAQGKTAAGPFVLGWLERWFLGSMEPPVRMRSRTGRAFVAPPELDPAPTVSRFFELQKGLADCVRSADGLDLRRIKVRSQFGPVSWSLNGTFAILLAHERRHLWQARQVLLDPSFPA
jgi:hypothetical protein